MEEIRAMTKILSYDSSCRCRNSNLTSPE